MFARLFPGGEAAGADRARTLADHGVEVEARPPGKKIKRLSCCPAGSGRRSRWRSWSRCSSPAPTRSTSWEVEAALDDVNLGRLLEIYTELRANSQRGITHQKRTMEIADALYGVTMRGDGVSAVISQRLRETESWRVGPGKGGCGGRRAILTGIARRPGRAWRRSASLRRVQDRGEDHVRVDSSFPRYV